MKCPVNYSILLDILNLITGDKKKTLQNSLMRNYTLTSSWVMETAELRIYHEGFYLTLYGTRCKFSVFAKDNDGEFIICRKPLEKQIHYLYTDTFKLSESDFNKFK